MVYAVMIWYTSVMAWYTKQYLASYVRVPKTEEIEKGARFVEMKVPISLLFPQSTIHCACLLAQDVH